MRSSSVYRLNLSIKLSRVHQAARNGVDREPATRANQQDLLLSGRRPRGPKDSTKISSTIFTDSTAYLTDIESAPKEMVKR